MIIRNLIAAVAAFPMLMGAAHASTLTFDSPGDTAGATVDRYAPAVFQSGVSFGGHAGTLEQGTAVSDGANNRPAAYSSSFYNTQGKSFALDPNTTAMSIQLYVPTGWTNATDGRYAGFWGVGYDATNSVSSYPIIELFRSGGVDMWRGWDSAGGWFTMGNASYGWNALDIQLLTGSDQFKYTVNGSLSALTGAYGTTEIGSAILQVYNTTEGVAYNAHWDNLTTAVPEPASWVLMIVGFGFVGAMLRKTRARPAEAALA